MNEKIYVAPEAVVVEFDEKDLLALSLGDGTVEKDNTTVKPW